ncbi:hypothetical protein Ga0123461_2309 [Mariprofundus aestuarium]|uniref:Uncharacterized protein n=1 Tax=Mariprofundus aestuarium TaxID=1921086 RepID=A0A2K8L090_MARES|nr:hypothetical protein Ga0123461_2309 [Mariprofundus aestuarium]
MEELFSTMFTVLFCSVFVWFFLCFKLFKILETRHPETYKTMGSPTLIMNNSLSNNISFMRFLFKREWRDLNDDGLSSLGKGMLTFFVIYSICFIFIFFAVALGYAS